MELKQLEYFVAICEEMHFTKTADKLGIGQPTLSYQIKGLEDELGVRLFDRLGKKIALTEAGKILLEHSHQIFNTIKGANEQLQELQKLDRGKLVIGAPSGELSQIALLALLEFHSMYPHIQIQFFVLDNVVEKIRQNEFDLALTIMPIDDDGLKIIPLYEEEYYLVVHSEHILADVNLLEITNLKDIPFIINQKDHCLRKWIDSICGNLGIMIQPIIETSDATSIVNLVKEGLGATILSKTLYNLVDNGQLMAIKLNPSLQRNVVMIHHKEKFIGSAMNIFRNLLNSHVEKFSRKKVIV
ncbi:LysR family transcriptional regulator [Bacillus sp. AFS055030]|uniref:LysR family transcriptional regulator n=1 Tax=Bacillus sp. AFS055030 TaxID=2033507 RepID=UPI000BFDEB78|nr:LysR family transcriptional regulator [Bacillus sp. AFS055030]PGL70708.1 LysR family transcriptional regulator [Bacillus sp. AFS055030]